MPNLPDIRTPDQRCFDGQLAGFAGCSEAQMVTRLEIMRRVAQRLPEHDPRHSTLSNLELGV